LIGLVQQASDRGSQPFVLAAGRAQPSRALGGVNPERAGEELAKPCPAPPRHHSLLGTPPIGKNRERKRLRALGLMLGYLRATTTTTGWSVTTHLNEEADKKGRRSRTPTVSGATSNPMRWAQPGST
jgi:hypothetical protein